MKILTVNALEKIFLDKQPSFIWTKDCMLKNERASYQVAICFEQEAFQECTVQVESPLKDYIQVCHVGHVPVCNATAPLADDYHLSKKPGVYPDLLVPDYEGKVYTITAYTWASFWVTVDSPAVAAGEYDIEFSVYALDKTLLGKCVFTMQVKEETLPKSDLLVTHWMHFDCISELHEVEPFTAEFYAVFAKYLQSYVRHGNTMLITPIFTPPLDTEIGKERETIQLVEVSLVNGEYSFGFDKLKEYIDFCSAAGIRHFEISHLFTQWGAKCCPKIMATADGEYKKIFGWENPADGEEYFAFLTAFLPKLTAFLEKNGVDAYFHISDEPNIDHLAHYGKLRNHVKQYIGDYSIMDALSDINFYKEKLVDKPVVALDYTKPFLEAGGDFWVYYCCGQHVKYVSNGFISMPCLRTAILGLQLYLTGVKGFLQWGFNFYHNFLSREIVNPFGNTDCSGTFPAGDGFLVYPDVNGGGMYESIRHESFLNGMQSYGLLRRLEEKKGREFCVQLLKDEGMETFFTYPHDDEWYANLICKIKAAL